MEEFSLERSDRDVYNAMLLEAQRHHHDFILDFKSDRALSGATGPGTSRC
jgi:hypothetical protein